jgi:hypothetical protein
MSSTIIAGPLANFDEKALKGVRRSRFSMHLKTRKVRRWLLVQLVSVPDDAQDADAPEFIRPSIEQEQAALPTRLTKLVDDYRLTQPMRAWA